MPRLILFAGFVLAIVVAAGEIATSSVNVLFVVVLVPVTALLGLLVFSFQRVRISEEDIVVQWFPFYFRRIPLRRIQSIDLVGEVKPLAYGGWGLRLHSRGFALVNATGPGLRITTSDGRFTVVTLPDAERIEAVFASLASPDSARS